MEPKAVLDAAQEAITDAKAATEAAREVIKEAKTATETNEEIITVLGGKDVWQKNLKDVKDAAQALAEGRSLVPKERLIEALAEINDEQNADRKARGYMVGGKHVDEAMAATFDIADGQFDYKSFCYATGKAVASPENKKDMLETAMGARPRNDAHREFQRAHAMLAVADAIGRAQHANRKDGTKYPGVRETVPQLAEVCDFHRARMLAQMSSKAALDPNDVVDTSLWVPTVLAPEVRKLLFLDLKVASLFKFSPYTGKAGAVDIPVNKTNSVGHLIPKAVGGGANVMGSTYALSNPFATTDPIQLGTQIVDDKASFNFQMIRGRTMWQGILDEDSPVNFLQTAQENILAEIFRAIEIGIISGQRSGEIDTGSGGVAALFYDPRNAWDGLRKHVRVQTGSTFGAGNAALTATMLMQNGPILGGKYMANPQQSAVILAVVSLFHIILDTMVVTADKFGSAATIFTGALAAVGGRPIYLSEFVPTNLNASGIFDNVTTDRTVALIAHRDSFEGMEHRAISVGVDYYRATDQNDAVGMWRGDFGKTMPSTEKAVVEITNLKTT